MVPPAARAPGAKSSLGYRRGGLPPDKPVAVLLTPMCEIGDPRRRNSASFRTPEVMADARYLGMDMTAGASGAPSAS
jgi:hypothetical protein